MARSLPPLDIKTNINHAPHVVILGAGASLAAFPNGDRHGMPLPLMHNLIEVVGLTPILKKHEITTQITNFEEFYDELATTNTNAVLLREIEEAVHEYFNKLELPDEATLYDYLLLSMREKDLIATFNWDPFLAKAYQRNIPVRKLPQVAFLHGNVEIGMCDTHQKKGFVLQTCPECQSQFSPSRLLFPVKQKKYNDDPFIKNEWDVLRDHLNRAYFVTSFGYSAPITDIEARKLMLDEWRNNPTVELGQIDIVDIKTREELENSWKDFFVKQHYGIYEDLLDTYIFRHPRRTCDAFAMATLQQQPWHENPLPIFKDLGQLQNWISPLLKEEEEGMLTGNPCPANG